MKTIAIVAGARPNFMKIARIVRARRKLGGDLGFTIIHTGQHYDIFFEELGHPVILCGASGTRFWWPPRYE